MAPSAAGHDALLVAQAEAAAGTDASVATGAGAALGKDGREEADELRPLQPIPTGVPPPVPPVDDVFLERVTDEGAGKVESEEDRRSRMWTEFKDKHPGINTIGDLEQRALFAAIDAKRQARERAEAKKHDLGAWSAQVLANCSAIMSDEARPDVQKWLASTVCISIMYFETIAVGVVPVLVMGWVIKQLESNSQAFVLCLLPYPFLVQMMFASILTKIDNTRHKLWILPAAEIAKDLARSTDYEASTPGGAAEPGSPDAQAERGDGGETAEEVKALETATADKLKELNVLQHGQAEMVRVAGLKQQIAEKEKELESLPTDADFALVDAVKAQLNDLQEALQDAEIEAHAAEANAGLAPRVPVSHKKTWRKLKKELDNIQNCKLGCKHILRVEEVEEEAIIPDPVKFPAEMMRTWKREFLILFITFMAVTAGFAFSKSGKVALSSCGFAELYRVQQREVTYRLVSHSAVCGSLGLADPKLFDAGRVARKKCAEMAHAQGLQFFNYASEPSSTLCINGVPTDTDSGQTDVTTISPNPCMGRCVMVNTTDASCPSCARFDSCARDEVVGGTFYDSQWDIFEAVGVSSSVDDCNCGAGTGWSTALGRCESGSDTDEEEALQCIEGPPLYAESIYTLYMAMLMVFIVGYSLVVAWIEHDLIVECPSFLRAKANDTTPGALPSGSVIVIARARKPLDTSAHEQNMKRWRAAINKVSYLYCDLRFLCSRFALRIPLQVEEIQRMDPSLLQGMQRHMHPMWMTMLMVLLCSSCIFYLFYIRCAVGFLRTLPAPAQVFTTALFKDSFRPYVISRDDPPRTGACVSQVCYRAV
eukprot:COSAG02_NODE_2040_length_10033_cov_3.206362_8_plen_824_part_00